MITHVPKSVPHKIGLAGLIWQKNLPKLVLPGPLLLRKLVQPDQLLQQKVVLLRQFCPLCGPTDLAVKMEKIPGVIKGRFYLSTPLIDSWEAFTPPHTGVTLERFFILVGIVAFFSPTSIESISYIASY